MEETIEREDDLKKLITEEGLLTPSPDFTARVMQMIEDTEKNTGMTYKPLLSRTAWILITAFSLLAMACCIWMVSVDSQDQRSYTQYLKPAIDFLRDFRFSIDLQSNVLLIATVIVACIGVLLSADIVISHRQRQVPA